MRKIIEKTKESLVEIEYTSEEEKFDINIYKQTFKIK